MPNLFLLCGRKDASEAVSKLSERQDECGDEDTCIKPYAHCINQITEEQVEKALNEMIMKRLSKSGE